LVEAVPVVVDTNVLRTAESTSEDMGRCAGAAANALLSARDAGVVLDGEREIMSEYLRNADPKREPKAGAAFLKWVLTNFANRDRCRIVTLKPHDDRGYESFPGTPDLVAFDRDDRKFVAAALVAECPLVLGLDTDYVEYRAPLERSGSELVFVCEPELAAAAERKGIRPVP
jgi:hypothetical protein